MEGEGGGGAGTSLPPPAFSFFYSLRPQRSLVQAKDRGPGEEDGEQKDRRRRPSSSCKREMATMVLKGTVVWTEEDARNGRIRFQQSTLSEVRARRCFKRNHQHSIPISSVSQRIGSFFSQQRVFVCFSIQVNVCSVGGKRETVGPTRAPAPPKSRPVFLRLSVATRRPAVPPRLFFSSSSVFLCPFGVPPPPLFMKRKRGGKKEKRRVSR